MAQHRALAASLLLAYGAANDLRLTRSFGEATAREARALGVHWVFAPFADVNNNPDNPINIRSFGEDPQMVAAHVASFIEGAHTDSAKLNSCNCQALSRTRRHECGYPHWAGNAQSGSRAAEYLAQESADEAVALVKNEMGLCP